MNIAKTAAGKWGIFSASGNVLSEHESNADAWRSLDRLMDEPVSRREGTVDWIWKERLDR